MKSSIIIGVILFLTSALLGILQLWFKVFEAENFVKIQITLVTLLIIDIVIAFVYREYRENKATREGNEL